MTAKRKSRLTPTSAEQPQQRNEPGAIAPQSHAVPAAGLFLNNDEAAKFLNLSPRTLEKQRVIGGGPRFRKFGRRVLYAAKDLEAWANSRTFETTSDPDYTPFR
jgi:hypothetical protein